MDDDEDAFRKVALNPFPPELDVLLGLVVGLKGQRLKPEAAVEEVGVRAFLEPSHDAAVGLVADGDCVACSNVSAYQRLTLVSLVHNFTLRRIR